MTRVKLAPIIVMILAAPSHAGPGGKILEAADSLRPVSDQGAVGELHEAAGYTPQRFTFTIVPAPPRITDADSIIRFPSPRPERGAPDSVNTVVLEWFVARNRGASPRRAPAVLVLHTLDRRLIIERGIARKLAEHGVHAFLIHLPGYGARTYRPFRGYGDRFFERAGQGISDARRARDVIATLAAVRGGGVCVLGVSLGGFTAVAAAALDDVFDKNFILLAGADLHGVLLNGNREAQWIRTSLNDHGVSDDQLADRCRAIEPARTAHRLNAAKTWLYSARSDLVVPPRYAVRLAETIGLRPDHHIWIRADHYTGLLYLPWIVPAIAERAASP